MKRKLLFYFTNSKSVWLLFGALFSFTLTNAQVNINMGSVASTSARIGNFYDSGGPSGSYVDNENYTFLISVPGATSISLTITAFSSESCCDYLQVFNGNNSLAPAMTPTTPTLGLRGTPTMPVTYTTTGSAMYITWISDVSVTAAGWTASWVATYPPSLNDVGVSSIDSPTIFCAPLQNVFATVTNFGKNSVTGFNVNWSLNGVLQTPVSSSVTLDTIGSVGASTAQIQLGSYTFPAGVNTVIRAWTSSPNGVPDGTTANDSASTSRAPAMSGVYTIGGVGGNYATINQAVTALQQGGVCGPVVFNVAPGTYTGQVNIEGPVAGTSAINTITFDGGSNTTTTLTYNYLSGSYATVIVKVPYVTLRNFNIVNTGASGGYGITIGNNYVTIKNCTVTVPNVNSSLYAGIAISGSGTSPTSAVSANYVEIDSCVVTNGYYGITNYASSSSPNLGLRITNTRVVSYKYYGIYLYYNSSVTMQNNYIKGTEGNQTGYGIYCSVLGANVAAGVNNIRNNRIVTPGYYGIYISSGTNFAGNKGFITNNMVGGHVVNTAYYSIYMTGCSNWYVAHNSFLNDVSNATINYGAAYFTGGSNLSVLNNIFARKNSSNNVTFYGSAATIFDTLNYNVFWRADTISNFAYLGTYYTPSNLRGVGGHNLNSVWANPVFTSDTLLTIGNSCINGLPLSYVTSDINGTARSITTPSIGANEYVKQTEDLMVEAITAPVAPLSSGYQDLTIRVKNQGSSTITSFNAAYTNNNGTPFVYNWSGTLAPCDVVSITFTGANQINITSLHNISVYTYSPNNLTDLNPANDTIKAQLLLPLNGNYTIGGLGASFATPSEAATALKLAGVTGPVNFTINAGTYTGQVLVEGPISGNTALNPITFDGVDASTRTISANLSQAAFLIRNASYITVRNLTITNTAASNATGIALVGNTTTNVGVSSSFIKNIINLPNLGTNTGWGIVVTGTPNGSGNSNNYVDSVTIDSNVINGGYYGITVYGNTTTPSTSRNRAHRVRYNTVNNAYYYGAYIYYNYNAVEFRGNTLNMIPSTSSTFNYGLYFYYNQNSAGTVPHRIIGNKINNASYMGAYIYYLASPTGVPAEIYNNVVTGTSNYSTYYAMYFYSAATTANVNIYHNTILADNAAGGTTYGFYYYNTTGTIQNVRNNIFGVSTNTAGGTNYACYFNNSLAALNVNFNNYYNRTSTNLVYRNAVTYNPSNFRTSAAGGDSSFNFTPSFVSLANPVLTEGCTRGFDLTSVVPTDIAGNTRSTAPNLGAYEFVGLSNDIGLEAMPYPVAPITLGAQDLAVRVRNFGTNTVTSLNVAYSLNNGTPVVYNWSGVLNACDTMTLVFTGANQITLGSSTSNIKVYTYSPNGSGDTNPGNDTIASTLLPPMSGNYTIGSAPSDFTTLNDAVTALASRGIAASVRFNIKTGTYNESLNLTGVIGTAANKTITFTSQANHVDSVVIASNNQYTLRFGPSASYFVFDRVTISQTHTANSNYAVTLSGNASYDTIRNSRINAVMNFATAPYNYTIYANGYTGTGFQVANNNIVGSYYGVYLFGSSRALPMYDLNVTGNTFSGYYYAPFYYLYYTARAKVNNNTFVGHNNSSTGMYQYHYYNDSGFQYMNNVWNHVAGRTLYHYMYYSNNAASNRSLIANNTASGAGSMYIYFGNTSTNNQDIVHNSFHVGAGYVYISYVTSLVNFRVLNNIFSGTGPYSAYISAIPSLPYLISNNNLVTAASATPYYVATTTYSLPAIRSSISGIENNSVSYRAPFVSTSSVIPVASDSAVWAINGRGTYLGYSLNDFNGVARPQTASAGVPDIGALEVTPTAVPPAAVAVPATPVAGGTQAFLFGTDTVAKITYDISSTPPTSVDVRYYSGEIHPQAGVNQNYTRAYADVTATGLGSYLFDFKLYYKNELIGTNPNETELRSARHNGSFWSVYTSTASTVDTIANVITTPGLTEFGSFIGTNDLNPLPVKLVSLAAKADGKNAIVSWTTANEKNAAYFEVYTATDGKTFKAIGKVKAAGNSEVMRNYTFTDANALAHAGTVYYKLKTVDNNGSFEWSQVVSVSTNNAKTNILSVYPNPFNNELTLTLADNADAQVEVISMEGLSVFSQHSTVQNGMVKLNGLNTLSNGVYFIKVTQNGNTSVQKLIKQ